MLGLCPLETRAFTTSCILPFSSPRRICCLSRHLGMDCSRCCRLKRSAWRQRRRRCRSCPLSVAWSPSRPFAPLPLPKKLSPTSMMFQKVETVVSFPRYALVSPRLHHLCLWACQPVRSSSSRLFPFYIQPWLSFSATPHPHLTVLFDVWRPLAGALSDVLSEFLALNFTKLKKQRLGVQEDKLGSAIQDALGITCQVLSAPSPPSCLSLFLSRNLNTFRSCFGVYACILPRLSSVCDSVSPPVCLSD